MPCTTNWYWLWPRSAAEAEVLDRRHEGRDAGNPGRASAQSRRGSSRAPGARSSASARRTCGRCWWSRSRSRRRRPRRRGRRRACREAPATFSCRATMSSNEMSWRASVETGSWPMSSCGRKPFGAATKSQAVATIVPRRPGAPAAAPRQKSSRRGTGERATTATGCAAVAACVRSARRGGRRAQSIGVSVSETKAEATMEIVTTTANSLKMRPTTPPISRTGRNTATSESVIETMVKPISRLPFSAASKAACPPPCGGRCSRA